MDSNCGGGTSRGGPDVRCRQRCFNFFDIKGSSLTAKLASVDGIAVPKEVARGLIQSAGLQQLPCGPHGCRVLCDVEMQDLSPIVAQDEQHKENPEGRRRDCEEIKRNEVSGMIIEKCPPALRWRSGPPDHVPGDSGLRDPDPQLLQLSMDPRRTPQRIGPTHALNEATDLRVDLREPPCERAGDY